VCFAYAHGDSYGNRYIHAYTYGIADRDCHIHAYSYRDCHSNGYSYRHSYGYAHTDTNSDLRPIHDQPDRWQHRARHHGHR